MTSINKEKFVSFLFIQYVAKMRKVLNVNLQNYKLKDDYEMK